MQRVNGIVQNYDWGDTTSIPALLRVAPDGRPHAELWFGTHRGAPSNLDDGTDLEHLTGPLPYLLKVLAAAHPLSLQVHPSSEQARAGFDRESARGIPLDSPQRTYRDPFHKPELIFALTRFEALCGIAPISATEQVLTSLGTAAASLRTTLDHAGIDGVVGLLLRDRPSLDDLVDAASHRGDDPNCRWLVSLAGQYPNDPSAALALFLNYVELQPGQAIYLRDGNMHAYLGGVGVEVMANSDNVVRCGLTSKHVDADEVLRVLDTTPLVEPVVPSTPDPEGGRTFPVPVSDFRLSVIDVNDVNDTTTWTARGAELILCIRGATDVVRAGECVVALDRESVTFVGDATLCRVGVGAQPVM